MTSASGLRRRLQQLLGRRLGQLPQHRADLGQPLLPLPQGVKAGGHAVVWPHPLAHHKVVLGVGSHLQRRQA